MPGLELAICASPSQEQAHFDVFSCGTSISSLCVTGGLFLDPTLPSSFINSISMRLSSTAISGSVSSSFYRCEPVVLGDFLCGKRDSMGVNGGFLSVSMRGSGVVTTTRNQKLFMVQNEYDGSEETTTSDGADALMERDKKEKVIVRNVGAMNTTNHLWAGAIAAMVSRTCVAPLERLKLEYIVRGEQRHLLDLVKSIAASQGLIGFWKGNLVNVLRTAPFKAVNFYANDTYRKQLLRLSKNEEITNFERFIAGAAAGITATVLCLPLDTIRTKIVAPGGEALGGVIGTFRHMIQTEGFFSLYKGLVPSILSMAPSGAVFYGVYDILKTAYLHSPEGRKRLENMNQHEQELNAFEKLELGPVRTLLYGAIAGACAEAATYPFEVVRRQLQLQVQEPKMGAFATCGKIVEKGGVQALYAGLFPSLLQVLPSAAISYFVYEFMKIVLKVE